jgi:cystathionine gamma-synthase
VGIYIYFLVSYKSDKEVFPPHPNIQSTPLFWTYERVVSIMIGWWLRNSEIIINVRLTKKFTSVKSKSYLNKSAIDSIFATAGCEDADLQTGALTPPIHFSTTYERDEDLELSRGFNYSRIGNPTRNLLETTFAKIENGVEAFAFSSGMQSATSILMCYPRAHVLLPDDLYHGVYVIILQIFQKWGVTFEKVDMTNHEVVKDRLSNHQNNNPVVLWLETPSNPLCKVTDIFKLSKISKEILGDNVCIVVDSTWSTPYLLRPLDLGADIVLHSTTKYICGHSDVLGGIAVLGNTSTANAVATTLRTIHQIGGGVCGPFDSWMTLRGLRTLHVRMKQHCENALIMSEFLQGHEKVEKVFYPGLLSHPQNQLASLQMNGRYGGMLSFLVKSKSNCAENALKVFFCFCFFCFSKIIQKSDD